MGRRANPAVAPFLCLISALTVSSPALAAAPPNDNYANATVVTALPFADTVDMSMATGEPAKGESPFWRTVWYQYAPATAQRVELRSQALGSATICVEGGDCSRGLGTCGTTYSLPMVLDLDSGRIYHFQLVTGSLQNVVFNLSLLPPPPPNDDIDQATVIGALPFTDSVDTISATRSADDPTTCGVAPNVWYQFTPPADMFVTIQLSGNYPPAWAILRGTRGALTVVKCGACSVLPPVLLEGGVTHYVKIAPFDFIFQQGFTGGNLLLSMDGVPAPPPPPNDDFDHATEIGALPFSDVTSALSATLAPDDPPACRFTQQQTIWFKFTPPADVSVMATTRGSDYSGSSVEIYTGSRGALTQVNPSCPVTTPLTGGVTYYLKVSLASAQLPGILRFNLDSVTLPRAAVKVFGQPGFTTDSANSGGRSASSLNFPGGVAVDASGEHLYVADRRNNRVLEYQSPATDDTTADHVFGQTNALGGTSFATGTANIGGVVSERGLSTPAEVTLDSGGNLYVADLANNRVLRYDNPLGSDAVADLVLGQPDFSTGSANTGGRSEFTLATPGGLAVDPEGNLYVGEFANTRAVRYDAPLFSSDDADLVFGEPDFTSADTPGTSATSLEATADVTLDRAGNLYVSDLRGGRVLRFSPPFTTSPPAADLVIGKPDFTTPNDPDESDLSQVACFTQGIGVSASSLCFPRSTAVDCAGNLYVADSAHSRVLIYEDPVTTDGVADEVLGQPNFTSMEWNWEGTVTARTLFFVNGVAVDDAGHLYVGDTNNSRVLMFEPIDMDDDGLAGAKDACLCEAPSLGLDADQNGCTDTLAGLRAIVDGLAISPDLEIGLLDKLDAAQRALDRHNARGATTKLQAFINQVEAQRGKGVSESDADLLVAYANNMIALIPGSA